MSGDLISKKKNVLFGKSLLRWSDFVLSIRFVGTYFEKSFFVTLRNWQIVHERSSKQIRGMRIHAKQDRLEEKATNSGTGLFEVAQTPKSFRMD